MRLENETENIATTPVNDARSGLRLVSGDPGDGAAADTRPDEDSASNSDREHGARDATMVLRDLVWRVDTVRYLAEAEDAPAKVKEIVALLDTSDVHAFLRSEP